MKIDVLTDRNIVVVTPDERLSASEIEAMKTALNSYINEHDRAPNLVIIAEHPPLWEDFDALKAHLALVRNHHEIVGKVAIVSDSTLLWAARGVADVFTKAKIRRFPEGARDAAIAWAQGAEDHRGDISTIEGLPRDTLGFRFTGTITSRDYADTLVPMVDAASKEHDHLKLLCVLDDDFDGYSAGAVWDDMRLGFSHLTTFSKVALVTDVEWIRKGAKFFGAMMPADVVVFDLDDLDDAKEWIRT